MESTMTKISKLRALIRELQKKYKKDAETTKCTSGLETQIKDMETQYDKCCDEKAKADSQGMSEEIYKSMEARIKEVLPSISDRDEDQEQHAAAAPNFLTAKKFYDKNEVLPQADSFVDSATTLARERLAPFPWAKVLDCDRVTKPHAKPAPDDAPECPEKPEFRTNIKSIGIPMSKSKNLLSHLEMSPALCRMYNECNEMGCIIFNVPSRNALAGRVVQHCMKEIDIILAVQKPLIFKLGFTHNPVWRWANRVYGYGKAKEKWSHMMILYISEEHFGPAMLEAALIDKYSTTGCRNINRGGDNVQSKDIPDSHYMTYIVYRSFTLRGSSKMICFAIFCIRATCRSAIRTARNLVSDLGDKAGSVAGLRELASCSETHSERDANRLLTGKLKLALPIPISKVPGDEFSEGEGLPMFRLRDWLAYILKINAWHHLCGLNAPNPKREQAIWGAFWEKYRALDPGHTVFQKAREGAVQLERCAAMLLHGDEGRGRRRQAFLVLSYHSCLGKGTAAAERARKAKKVKKPYLKMATNFGGHTYTTRFLAAAMTRKMYNDNDHFFDGLMTSIADEAAHLANCGVEDRYGQKHWVIVLRTIGDWPWLHRAAKLNRTYANVVKRLDQTPGGICHLCDAGTDAYPFEQIGTRRPRWLSTMYQTCPFDEVPFMARVPHNPARLAAHYAFDVFHTVQLGIGRYLTGTMLALWSDREAGNIEERFDSITTKYRAFCKASGRAMFVSKLTKDTIQWTSTTEYPAAGWYKGQLTTNVMEFLQHLGESIDMNGDDVDLLLSMGTEAVVSLNSFMRLLYESAVWIPPADAGRAGDLAAKFLRRYNDCAVRARSLQRTLELAAKMAMDDNGLLGGGGECRDHGDVTAAAMVMLVMPAVENDREGEADGTVDED
ncbi:unnamed protein product [Symbiodinium sp. CCMP2592]|nr:unnamed protein product [Symbiodinium sp. CCMP2592]